MGHGTKYKMMMVIQITFVSVRVIWGTGIRGLMRGMATLPKVTRSTAPGCPLFLNIDFPCLFHDQKMKIHDLRTIYISK